tara:strand:- start:11796 stop:12683 length:888 start_codon:yes stop_codon:yes gene_type:complete
MAYTAYKTWTVGEILTAANMNAQVRDNGLLGPEALATADGELWVATAANAGQMESGATLRTSIGVAIGTDVQAWDAFLDDIAALTDPGADRIPFWDDTAGNIVWLTVGSGLTITDTTIAASAGQLILIGTAAASASATLDVTGLDETYDTYMIAIADIDVATDGAEPWLRLGDSGGVDSGATDYEWHTTNIVTNANTYAAHASGGDSKIQLAGGGIGNAAGEGFGGVYFLHVPGDAAMRPMVTGSGMTFTVTPDARICHMGGMRRAVLTLDRVQFLLSAGNVTAGRLTVLGIKHD